jgi:D-lactate dehydrogenase
MKLTVFSTQPYDRDFFEKYRSEYGLETEYLDMQLSARSVELAAGADAVCVFVNDRVDAPVISELSRLGVRLVALRCAGFNNVDLTAARQQGIRVCRVPAYSPQAVAEHAVAMILTLNRKTHKAYNRVREQNFSLNGLLGFDLHGKTVGVIGTGNIGKAFCRIMLGFGCRILTFDLNRDPELEQAGVRYAQMQEILSQSDIISLHCPLTESTRHLVNKDTLHQMKKGVMLINTSRGGLIDTHAIIAKLKSKRVGYLGIDVYEQEEQLFFRDLSASIIEDDTIQRLMSFPNVLVTAHQAFFTEEALVQITRKTLCNTRDFLFGHNPEDQAAWLV